MEEDEGDVVVCLVNLDEENRVVSLDDSFGEGGHYGSN
jgi:hypothetical protein